MDYQIESKKNSKAELKAKLSNKWWRLNNLYWIIDKKGKKVKFKCNWMQTKLYDELWYLNIILKARQFGGTTFVDIYFLDECLFNENVEAGIIAHNKEDAQKIFRRKVKYPYDNLPGWLKDERKLLTDSKTELAFNNGSIIYVGTSMRSGTLQYLHVSEHGKICRKYPEKAEEIRTGSLNAVEAGQMVVIESTAEGAVGDFHKFCKKAQDKKEKGEELTPLDFKFHFFPWHWNPEYSMEPGNVVIPEEDTKYFNAIERTQKVTLNDRQRAWYVKKREIQGDLMKQEYPSTPEEAFESRFDGFAFYKDHHVISPMAIPDAAPIYMTFDWGFGRPYSIGYWWVDADNRVYRFAEIYGCKDPVDRPDVGLRQTDEEIAEKIIAKEEELGLTGRHIDRLCDPTCFNKKPDYKGGGQGISTADVFNKYEIYLMAGDANRALKKRQFHSRLRLLKDAPPMMLIYNTCTQFIRTVPLLHCDKNNVEDIDKKLEDHPYDEAALIVMARPLSLETLGPAANPIDRRLDMLEKGTTNDSDEWERQHIAESKHMDSFSDGFHEEGINDFDGGGTVSDF